MTKEYKEIDIEKLNPRHFIIIKGARVNNLKNINVAIPRNKLVVVTGLSGSGKSSLAFDTLFAEGQRMYVESLSSYARQFLGRMEKPEVDYIRGVSPAVAIEQKVNTRNPRSTVGTTTEIYDYLKLLYARIGKTYSPVSGEVVSKDSVTDVVNFLNELPDGSRVMISCPLKIRDKRSVTEELKILLSKGFTRIIRDGEVAFIEDELKDKPSAKSYEILIDRAATASEDEDMQFRLADSVQTSFFEGEGDCYIYVVGDERYHFTDRFEKDGIKFEEPTVNFFSFNNPFGACKTCEGFGKVLGIDEDLVFPDKSLSVYEGAIAPWRSERMNKWLQPLLKRGIEFDFPIHREINDLTEEQYKLLWTGNKYFDGLNSFFKNIERQTHKIQYRVLLSRYRGRTTCPDCRGTRLRKDASYVKVGDRSITDLVLLPVDQLKEFFKTISLSSNEEKVAGRLILEIKNRLDYLIKVGLGYLSLNRLTSTLSGGEFQRIKLATSLGSALVGSMYILDEPSIGLHPRDTQRLVEVLEHLRNLGNTVVVVEHEEEIMRSADQIIDIGPDAGAHGGELVFQGTINDINKGPETHTTAFLSGKAEIKTPETRRKWKDSVIIHGARENNLKNVTVEFPLGVLTAVTGVSGSGKSTLINNILYPALSKARGFGGEATGKHDKISGDYNTISHIEYVDQNPIGKSSRSNPVTYVKAYDGIRQLFAEQQLSKQRGYKPSHFSFNVEGGRCEVCQGEGTQKIEMQFMADIYLTCEGCKGKRFKQEILEVTFEDKNISDILNLTVDESIELFLNKTPIVSKLLPLQEVGLGYVRLGQSSNSLSGGEAQRVKLGSYLSRGASADKGMFIFDEPTTGLHFHDIEKLLKSMNALVNQGNTVVVIEHNIEVIKSADWIIDLGPEGGDKGGNIVFSGTPEDMIKQKDGYTVNYLKSKL